MTNSDSASLDEGAPDVQPSAASRAGALNRIREAENERLGVERVARFRLMWLGITVGATVGLTVGYLATLITIVDSGISQFGFQFYRPDFVEGFLRIVTAYLIGGGIVGGATAYFLFTTRAEAASPMRWIIAGCVYAVGAPLAIGFLLPLTLLIFVDVIEGLRPGLWLSAFAETLLGSFLDGYIFMVKVLYAGVTGALLYVLVFLAAHIASNRLTLAGRLVGSSAKSIIVYIAAVAVALVPLLLLAAGPFSMVSDFTAMLTGERL